MAENEIFKNGKMSVDVAPRTVGILKTSIQFSTQDQGTAKLIFSLSKDGLPLPLSSAATAKIFLRMADGSVFEKTVSIVDQINGKLEYVLEEEISHPGLAKGELNINFANGQALSVCKFSFNIDSSLMDQDIVPLAEYYVKDFNTLQTDIEQRAAVIHETVDEMQEKVDAFESTAVTLDPRLTTVEEKVATATVQLAETAKKSEIESLTSNKADKAYVDQITTSLGSGSPKGVYATVSALQTAFPTGNTNLYVVSADGKWYYWNGTAWAAGSVYQATAIADKSVTPEKMSIVKFGKNMFNPDTAVAGYYVNQTSGIIQAGASYTTSDFIPVLPNTQYTRSYDNRAAFYDVNKVFISGHYDATNATKTLTTPANAAFMRTTTTTGNLSNFQVELGSSQTSYEAYKQVIDPKYVEKQTILPSDIPPIAPDRLTFSKPSSNLFDKTKVTMGAYINMSTGGDTLGAGYATSPYIPVEQNSQYIISNVRGIMYYDSTKVKISGEADTSPRNNAVITTPANTAYMRFYVYDTTAMQGRLDALQVNKGTSLLPYEGFTYKIQKENLDPTNIQESLSANIALPDKIFGVVGKEISLYFNNPVDMPLNDYMVDVTCSIGMQEKRRWVCTPSAAGTYPLTISLYRNYKLITAKQVSFIVSAATAGTGDKTVLVIGDSTINQVRPTQRLLDLTASDSMTITLLGTRGTGPNKHEGRGGWKFETYRTGNTYLGTVNPFYNPAKTDFDFAYYMANQAFAVPDYVIISLGINDTFGATSDSSAEAIIDTIFTHSDFIVNSIKSYNAGIKVGICLTIPPNESQDAFGLAYGNDQPQWRYKRNNAIWLKRLIAKYGKREGENIYLIPDNTNIDAVNGFNIDANGGVHPNAVGDNQRGDTFYYWLKSFES